MSVVRRFFKRVSTLCIVANWVLWLGISALMANGPEGFLVFVKLPWTSFLTDLGGMATLSAVDAGSIWIAWLVCSCATSFLWWASGPVEHAANTLHPVDGVTLVKFRKIEIESAPALKDRLSKLNHLLQKSSGKTIP